MPERLDLDEVELEVPHKFILLVLREPWGLKLSLTQSSGGRASESFGSWPSQRLATESRAARGSDPRYGHYCRGCGNSWRSCPSNCATSCKTSATPSPPTLVRPPATLATAFGPLPGPESFGC